MLLSNMYLRLGMWHSFTGGWCDGGLLDVCLITACVLLGTIQNTIQNVNNSHCQCQSAVCILIMSVDELVIFLSKMSYLIVGLMYYKWRIFSVCVVCSLLYLSNSMCWTGFWKFYIQYYSL